MPRTCLVYDTPDDVARNAAHVMAAGLRSGARTLVLAGGAVNIRAYGYLAGEPGIEWGRIVALFGDERCVPPDHPESNYRQAREALLDRVRPGAVLRMPGELGPDEGAAVYEGWLAAAGPLDLLMLGMGPDGHTASLFPGNPALEARGTVVGVRGSPKPPPERISLTIATLRAARRSVILATGADKAEAVLRATRGEVPAGMVEEATLMVDRAAAGRMPEVLPAG
jgi:6-phosphogluconolactonase